jgi:hypothetical protein
MKYLDQEQVTRYAQIAAEIKKLEEQKSVLREELIAGFKEGLKCPSRGPYLLTLTYQERRTISWKDEFVKLAKDQLGKAWRKYQLSIENEAPVVHTPMLLPAVNPDYEAEAMAKRGAA